MQKKHLILVSTILFLILVVHLTGCTTTEETLDQTIKRIKDSGKLVVGTSTPYPPLEYIDTNGDVVGFDIDIATEIAKKLGVELEIHDMNFDLLIDDVENGGIDIAIAAITITVERQQQVLFSNPYFNAGQVIVTKNSNENINTPDDLDNKIVGVQNATTSYTEAIKYTNVSLIKTYDDYVNATDDLVSGIIDAIIIDYPAATGLVDSSSEIKIVGDPFTDELYGIAIKKGENALKNEIDQIISSGIIDTIEDKWFN